MTLSVVILFGRGRPEEALHKALHALRSQTQAPDEVVLVVNGAEVPRISAHEDLRLKTVVAKDDVGCPAGRNMGARAANGDILVFSDDDGELDSSALEVVAAAFQAHADVAAFAGTIIDPGLASRPELWADRRHSEQTVHFRGGAFAIRRAAFLEVGGYPEYIVRQGEELDLALKLLGVRQEIRTLPEFVLFHADGRRRWNSDHELMGTSNTIRIFAARLPFVAAGPVAVWKFVRHSVLLLNEGGAARIPTLLRDAVHAMVCGLRNRDPLKWTEYWAARKLIHPRFGAIPGDHR